MDITGRYIVVAWKVMMVSLLCLASHPQTVANYAVPPSYRFTNNSTKAAFPDADAAARSATHARPVRTNESALADRPDPMSQPGNEPITIAAVGDIMIGSTFPDSSRLPPDDGNGLLQAFAPILRDADVAFGNLEGPLLEGGVSTKCGQAREPKQNCFAFRVPTHYGQYIKAAGFDVMSLANNHAGDFGDQGRASTRRVLDELGIKHIGSDRSHFASAIITVKGKRIGFVGFAHNDVVPNVNDLAFARELVSELKREVDLVVVSFHGGAEGPAHQHVPRETEMFFGEPRGNLREFAHAVVDAGADLVIGHGPHVMRGMEIYKDRLIAYSMGNFCTYGWFTLKAETALTAVFEIKLAPDGTFQSGKLYPGRQDGLGGPLPDPSGEAIRIVRQLSEDDFGADAPSFAPDGSFTR